MKIEGYDVKELAPGVKEYTLQGQNHVTFTKAAPWVHIHYPMGDDEADELGYTEAELCCHGCNEALWVTLDWPLEEDAAKPIHEDFTKRHAGCWATHKPASTVEEAVSAALVAQGHHPMESMCPRDRASIHALDLRGKMP